MRDAAVPETRARHPLTMLELARDRDAQHHARALSFLSAEVRKQLDAALTLAWVPVSTDIAVIEAVDRAFGRAAMHSIALARQERELGSPLFRTFVAGALALARASPAFLVRRIPDAWGLLFRECGRLEVEAELASSSILAIHDLPRECLASEAWMSCIPVAYGASPALVNRRGRATLDVRAGTARVTVSWT